MKSAVNNIIVKVVHGGEEFELRTHTGEYRNLMMLIYDKIYVEDFGECRGMGRCGTCLIEVLESDTVLPQFDRNEFATINKAGISNPNVRLACQILVNDSLNNTRVKIWTEEY